MQFVFPTNENDFIPLDVEAIQVSHQGHLKGLFLPALLEIQQSTTAQDSPYEI